MAIKNNSRKIGIGSVILLLVLNVIFMWMLLGLLGIDVTAQFESIISGIAKNELTTAAVLISAVIVGILSANITGIIIEDEQ